MDSVKAYGFVYNCPSISHNVIIPWTQSVQFIIWFKQKKDEQLLMVFTAFEWGKYSILHDTTRGQY